MTTEALSQRGMLYDKWKPFQQERQATSGSPFTERPADAPGEALEYAYVNRKPSCREASRQAWRGIKYADDKRKPSRKRGQRTGKRRLVGTMYSQLILKWRSQTRTFASLRYSSAFAISKSITRSRESISIRSVDKKLKWRI